jgi:DNA-binding protein H-NS
MKQAELDRMSTDELWSLHVEVTQLLQQRIQQEKLQLDERLKLLQTAVVSGAVSARRPYPPVLPKYFNPDQPSETWSGRGKRPRWLVAQLKSGKRIEDLRIQVRNKKQISDRRAESKRQRS